MCIRDRSTGGLSAFESGLSAGMHTVTVTDANGCTETAMVMITEPDALNINGVVTDIDCNGDGDGNIDISVSGGTAAYSYAWSTLDGSGLAATDEDQASLGGGTYTVDVTDANGCTISATYTVVEPTDLVITGVGTDPSCDGDNDGSVTVTASGGVTPYSYTNNGCLLYTSPSPRDATLSRMPSSA